MFRKIEASIVRIYRDTVNIVTPVGAGLLFEDRKIITCAHVIAKALNFSDNEPISAVNQHVQIDFPLIPNSQKLTASVTFWPDADYNIPINDFCILELVESPPTEAISTPMVLVEDFIDHSYRVYGFPRGRDDGLWSLGTIVGSQAQGLLQLHGDKPSGIGIEEGFSGSPVFDTNINSIVGIVVAIDRDRERRIAYVLPTTRIADLIPEVGNSIKKYNPYKGLSTFREQDASYFFGRDQIVKKIYERLTKQNFLGVIGPSGSGKSSVVYAGVIPKLHEQNGWSIISFRPGSSPFSSLAISLFQQLDEFDANKSNLLQRVDEITSDLIADTTNLAKYVNLHLNANEEERIVFFIDQFEELVTLCTSETERNRFLDMLCANVKSNSNDRNSKFRFIITLRADFLDYFLNHIDFAEIFQDRDVVLPPMNEEEVIDAITQPAQMHDVNFAEGLPDRVYQDTIGESGYLPLLQFSLQNLWDKQTHMHISHENYNAIGGLKGSITKFANNEIDAFSDTEKILIRDVFLQLVQPSRTGDDTKRTATKDELSQLIRGKWSLVYKLADSRLIVTSRNALGQETFELAHEALIDSWQKLRDWVDEDRLFRVWQEKLRSSIYEWERLNKDPDALLRGVRLSEALEWLKSVAHKISQKESEFIEASRAYKEAEDKALERRRRVIIFSLTIFSIFAIILSLIAIMFAQEASNRATENEIQASENRSLELSARALEALANDDTQTGLMLAIEANNQSHVPYQAFQTLAQVAYTPGIRSIFTGHTDVITSVQFIDSGNQIITSSWDGRIILWDTSDERPLQTFTGHSVGVDNIMIDENNRRLLSSSRDSTILWNLDTGEQIVRQVFGSPAIDMSNDGSLFALRSRINNSVVISQVEDFSPIMSFGGHTDIVTRVKFSPDNQYIISGGDNGELLMWDVNSGELERDFVGHTRAIYDIEFHPDDNLFASSSWDGNIILWDIDTGQTVRTFTGHSEVVLDIEFNQNGSLLVSASADDTLKLWDVDSGLQIRTFRGHLSSVWSVDFHPSDQQIISGSRDHNLILWDLLDGTISQQFYTETDYIETLDIQDDNQLFSISRSGTLNVYEWEGTSHQLVGMYDTEQTLQDFSIESNGDVVILGSLGGEILIWNHVDDNLISTFNIRNAVVSLTLTPNGRYLLIGDNVGMFYMYDMVQEVIVTEQNIHSSSIKDIYVLDNDTVLVASWSGIITRWNIADRQPECWQTDSDELCELVHDSPIYEIKASDNYIFVAAANSHIYVWNTSTGNLVTQLSAHTDEVRGIDYLSERNYLISGGRDNQIILWDISDFSILFIYTHDHEWVNAIEFMNERNAFVVGFSDGFIIQYLYHSSDQLEIWLAENRYLEDIECQEVTLGLDELSCQDNINLSNRDLSNQITSERRLPIGYGTPVSGCLEENEEHTWRFFIPPIGSNIWFDLQVITGDLEIDVSDQNGWYSGDNDISEASVELTSLEGTEGCYTLTIRSDFEDIGDER